MGRVLLDISVLIALERKHLTRAEVFQLDEDVMVPAIAIAEYLVALHRSKNPRHKELIMLNLEAIDTLTTVVDFGEREAKAFAILKAEALRSGIGRTDFDLAIAAHSVTEDAMLVTRDKNSRLSELTGVVTREV